MNQDPVAVSRIDWLKIFPGLHLPKAFGLGFRLRILLTALLFLGVVRVGLYGLDGFSVSRHTERLRIAYPIKIYAGQTLRELTTGFPRPIAMGKESAGRLMFSARLPNDVSEYGILALVILCMAVFGPAVGRSTATEFCVHSRTGAFASLKFSLSHFGRSMVSTFLALLLICIPWVFIKAAAWLCQPGTLWAVLAMIGWILFYAAAALAFLATVVISLGWLLSLAAIGTDQCDGADALSRGINYILSHKFKTLFYLLVVTVVAELAGLLTLAVAGYSSEIIEVRFSDMIRTASGPMSAWDIAAVLYTLSIAVLAYLPHAVHLGVFLAGITVMYLLLRQAEDAVQLREIDGGRGLN